MITPMNLGYGNLTGAGVLEKLSNNSKKKPDSLLLYNNCIDDKGIETILGSPKINNVYYLDLHRNQIGDEGALAIIHSSNTNNVSSVNLSNNNISASGIVALAEELPRSQIVSLDLRFNPGSKCPLAFKALVTAVNKHKILQYLQTDHDLCKSALLPVLRNNRDYVYKTIRELKDLIASLKDIDSLHFPMETLDFDTLKKCELFFNNRMLFSFHDATDKSTLVKIRNYINDHYFKITGIINKRLSAVRTQSADSASMAVLPTEVLSSITKYCRISDVQIK